MPDATAIKMIAHKKDLIVFNERKIIIDLHTDLISLQPPTDDSKRQPNYWQQIKDICSRIAGGCCVSPSHEYDLRLYSSS